MCGRGEQHRGDGCGSPAAQPSVAPAARPCLRTRPSLVQGTATRTLLEAVRCWGARKSALLLQPCHMPFFCWLHTHGAAALSNCSAFGEAIVSYQVPRTSITYPAYQVMVLPNALRRGSPLVWSTSLPTCPAAACSEHCGRRLPFQGAAVVVGVSRT